MDDETVSGTVRTGCGCGRREVLMASGGAAAGVLLAGCGSAAQRASDAASTNRDVASAVAEAAGEPVATTADVPVGGGIIRANAQVVITQPTEGEFRAFSTTCPHEGCAVSRVEDGRIFCPCHGSTFDFDSGEVVSGPARSGLTAKAVSVDGDEISVD